MREKILKTLEREFVAEVQKALPEFKACKSMSMWSPALRASLRKDLHFFLALDPIEDRDSFDVVCGVATKPDFPLYVGTMAPSDPPENGALAFPVWTLWYQGAFPPIWHIVDEPAAGLNGSIDAWSRPAPAIGQVISRIPAVVVKCIDDMQIPLTGFIVKCQEDSSFLM